MPIEKLKVGRRYHQGPRMRNWRDFYDRGLEDGGEQRIRQRARGTEKHGFSNDLVIGCMQRDIAMLLGEIDRLRKADDETYAVAPRFAVPVS